MAASFSPEFSGQGLVMGLVAELKRRNVFRVGIAYVVASWLLLQVTDVLMQVLDLPDWTGRLVFTLLLIGFIPTLMFSWAYEITPEGLKREKDIDHDAAITGVTAKKLDKVTIALVIAVAAMVVIDRYLPVRTEPVPPLSRADEPITVNPSPVATETPSDEQSIAVLPFVNMSSDPEQEFFSDGISEEILNDLTRIPNLKVAARTSSFQFKGQNLDVSEVGKTLKVRHVLEGSVRKYDDQLRITAQLIDAESGYHLWSETYDRKLQDVFAIQDEIAQAIADELKVRLSSAGGETPNDMAVYEMYLQARPLIAERREESLDRAIELMDEAVASDPEYAPAMAMLALAWAVRPWWDNAYHFGEASPIAEKWANNALTIDPENADALAVAALVKFTGEQDWMASKSLFERALAVNPGNASLHNFYGDLLLRMGDLENSLKHEARAVELDPLSPVQHTDLAQAYWIAGQQQESMKSARRALALDPEFDRATRSLVNSWYALGRADRIRELLGDGEDWRNSYQADQWYSTLQLYAVEERDEAAEALLDHARELADRGLISSSWVAFNYASVGDFDMAGDYLLRAQERGETIWSFPGSIRMPEQAPDSASWQQAWSTPRAAALAEIRRRNGLNPFPPQFGEEASP
jgi:TolB-like protein/Tfp pilus assembly protein PilF